MATEFQFKVGEYYRTREGHKALCVHIWSDGSGLFVCQTGSKHAWLTYSDAHCVGTGHERINDIVAEWREPRQWTICVVECYDGLVGVTTEPGNRTVLARVTVTEGEGLE
jgi:hypothetical protein